MKFKKLIKNKFLKIKRSINPIDWGDFFSLTPVSNVFGFDRGTPIDRGYIEHFLKNNEKLITGSVCEIGSDFYSKKFGSNLKELKIFEFSNQEGEYSGDLSKGTALKESSLDCFVVTQTLNFIEDYKSAIVNIKKMLKPGGVALVTVAGICQISRYDMDRWGDFYRFTDKSMRKIFNDIFDENTVEVKTYGNLLSATALLHGICMEDIPKDDFYFEDKDYQVVITIKAIKK